MFDYIRSFTPKPISGIESVAAALAKNANDIRPGMIVVFSEGGKVGCRPGVCGGVVVCCLYLLPHPALYGQSKAACFHPSAFRPSAPRRESTAPPALSPPRLWDVFA